MTPNTPNTTPDTSSSPQTRDYDRTQSAHDAVNDLIAQQAEEPK